MNNPKPIHRPRFLMVRTLMLLCASFASAHAGSTPTMPNTEATTQVQVTPGQWIVESGLDIEQSSLVDEHQKLKQLTTKVLGSSQRKVLPTEELPIDHLAWALVLPRLAASERSVADEVRAKQQAIEADADNPAVTFVYRSEIHQLTAGPVTYLAYTTNRTFRKRAITRLQTRVLLTYEGERLVGIFDDSLHNKGGVGFRTINTTLTWGDGQPKSLVQEEHANVLVVSREGSKQIERATRSTMRYRPEARP